MKGFCRRESARTEKANERRGTRDAAWARGVGRGAGRPGAEYLSTHLYYMYYGVVDAATNYNDN